MRKVRRGLHGAGLAPQQCWFHCFGCCLFGKHMGGLLSGALESPRSGASIPPKITQFGPVVAEI